MSQEYPDGGEDDQELAVRRLLTELVDPELEAMKYCLTLSTQERFLNMLRSLESMNALRNAPHQPK